MIDNKTFTLKHKSFLIHGLFAQAFLGGIFKQILFWRAVLIHNKVEQKEEKVSTYPCYYTCIASPITNIFHSSDAFVMTNEPALTLNDTHHPKYILYIMVHSWYCMLYVLTQSCLTLCDPMDWATDSSVHGIFPGKNTGVDCHLLLQGSSNPCYLSLLHCRQTLYHCAIGKALYIL